MDCLGQYFSLHLGTDNQIKKDKISLQFTDSSKVHYLKNILLKDPTNYPVHDPALFCISLSIILEEGFVYLFMVFDFSHADRRRPAVSLH